LASKASYAGGEVADIDDFFVDVGQVEVDEGSDLGLLLQDGGVGVDEERAGQRVAAIFDVSAVGSTPVDGEDLEAAAFSA
jgi:hypothetical protein